MDALNRLAGRIKGLLARGVISLISDGGQYQFAQVEVMAGEVKADVQRFQNFGFTGNPPGGSIALVGFLGGDRDHPVILYAEDPATRKSGLKAGESAVYNAFKDFIHLKENGEVEIKCKNLIVNASEGVRMASPRVETTHDLIDRTEDGNIKTINDMRNSHDGHKHLSNGDDVLTDGPDTLMGGGL